MGAEEQTEEATEGSFQGRGNREHESGAPFGPQVISHHGYCLPYLCGLVYILEGETHCAIDHPFPLLSPSLQSIPGTKPYLSLTWVH